MYIRFSIQLILIGLLFHNGSIFGASLKDLRLLNNKEEIKTLYKGAAKAARTYLALNDTQPSQAVLEKKIMRVLEGVLDSVAHQCKDYTANNMQWYGQNGLEDRHTKGVLIKPRALGEFSEKGMYYTGSTEALEYSTSLFLIKSCEAIIKELYEQFDIGYDDKTNQTILYPKSGIAAEKALAHEKSLTE